MNDSEFGPMIRQIELRDGELSFIESVVEDFPHEFGYGNESDAVDWVEDRMQSVTAPIPERLLEFRQSLSDGTVDGIHVVGIELPTRLPPTPNSYNPIDQAEIYGFDLPQLALSALLGASFGAKHIRGGRIIADVFPKPGYEDKPDSAFGSERNFDFHVDDAVSPDTSPDYFSLHCIRNNDRVPTIVSTVAFDELSPSAQTALSQPAFRIYYEAISEGAHSLVTPIIENGGQPDQTLHFYGSSKVSYNVAIKELPEFEEAIQEFRSHLDDNALPIVLDRGDMLFVNNNNVLHSRPPFSVSDTPQPTRRWLRRVHTASRDQLVKRVVGKGNRVLSSEYIG